MICCATSVIAYRAPAPAHKISSSTWCHATQVVAACSSLLACGLQVQHEAGCADGPVLNQAQFENSAKAVAKGLGRGVQAYRAAMLLGKASADGCSAAIWPGNGIVQRSTGFRVPDYGGLPLIGDPDCSDDDLA